MRISINKLRAPLFLLAMLCTFSPSSGQDKVITDDLNLFFSDLDESFSRIVESGALRSTSLKPAERLFIREMRKNRSFSTFTRTNTKGMVISEAIRGEKVERPMRDVSSERWFRDVTTKKEPFYTLIKDPDRGRYYLLWARPIIKQGDRCIGTVLLRIDLWDSFYEFSNDIYFPFLIKLGRKSLFSHKWKEGGTAKEEQLTIQGIDRITVTYIPEKKQPATTVAPAATDTASQKAQFSVGDSAKQFKQKSTKKGGTSGVALFFLIVLVLAIIGASAMLIAWMRRRAVVRHIDEEDSI